MKQLRDGFNMELKFARLRRYLGRLAFIAELHKVTNVKSHAFYLVWEPAT